MSAPKRIARMLSPSTYTIHFPSAEISAKLGAVCPVASAVGGALPSDRARRSPPGALAKRSLLSGDQDCGPASLAIFVAGP